MFSKLLSVPRARGFRQKNLLDLQRGHAAYSVALRIPMRIVREEDRPTSIKENGCVANEKKKKNCGAKYEIHRLKFSIFLHHRASVEQL